MIAEEGKTYAQVVDGICHWIFTKDDLPEWSDEQCPAVDVTGNIPNIGDVYADGVFSAPPQVIVPWSSTPTLTKVRDARETVLNRLAGIALFSGDSTVTAACASARIALLALPDLPQVKAATNETDLSTALTVAYLSIVASVPDSVKTAFSEFQL